MASRAPVSHIIHRRPTTSPCQRRWECDYNARHFRFARWGRHHIVFPAVRAAVRRHHFNIRMTKSKSGPSRDAGFTRDQTISASRVARAEVDGLHRPNGPRQEHHDCASHRYLPGSSGPHASPIAATWFFEAIARGAPESRVICRKIRRRSISNIAQFGEYLKYARISRDVFRAECPRTRRRPVFELCNLERTASEALSVPLSRGYRQRVGARDACPTIPTARSLDEPTIGSRPETKSGRCAKN